jgi:CheY-like chemotaxis protein
VRGNRVVIADDDPDFRQILRSHLEAHGFVVVGEAANGPAAVSITFKEDPDFLTLDSHMPYLGGEEAMEHIADIRPGTTVVAVSGSIDRAPEWAEEFVPKTELSRLGPLLNRLRGLGR